MIPVYLDCGRRQVARDNGKGGTEQATEQFVAAECAKCGKCAEAVVSDKAIDGTPSARAKTAKAEALAALTALCDERLPWGVPIPHEERHVPRGVSVIVRAADGQTLPCMVNRGTAAGKLVVVLCQGKLEIPHVGVPPDAEVFVVPETEKAHDAAVEFARELVGRGYKRARVQTSLPKAA